MFISIKHHNKAQTYITMSNSIDEAKAKVREYNKKYKAENREKINEKQNKKRAENKDAINEKRRQNRDKDAINEYVRQYRTINNVAHNEKKNCIERR